MNASSGAAVPQHVLVTGLVRNCALGIRADLQRMRAACRAIPHLHWLLVESDSSDDSVATLSALGREIDNFRFVSLGSLRRRLPLRSDRLAACRNAYLDEIAANPLYREIELVVVADFDGVNTLIDEAALASCWRRSDWSVCAANPAAPYYDIWALRHALWSPNDCWAHYRFLVGHGARAEQALQVAVHGRMLTLPREAAWIEVESAFGGLALYRRQALVGARYHGLDAEGGEVCEHVALHRDIRARQHRIFINPGLINTGITEHTEHLRFSRRLLRLAKAGARALGASRLRRAAT